MLQAPPGARIGRIERQRSHAGLGEIGHDPANACPAVRRPAAHGFHVRPGIADANDDRALPALGEKAAYRCAEIAGTVRRVGRRNRPRAPVVQAVEGFPALDGDRQLLERAELRVATAPRPVDPAGGTQVLGHLFGQRRVAATNMADEAGDVGALRRRRGARACGFEFERHHRSSWNARELARPWVGARRNRPTFRSPFPRRRARSPPSRRRRRLSRRASGRCISSGSRWRAPSSVPSPAPRRAG